MSSAGNVPNFVAASEQTIFPFRICKMGGQNFTLQAANTPNDIVLGVADGSTYRFDSTAHAIAGGVVNIQNGKFVQLQAGSAITAGDLLAVSTAGVVIPAAGTRAYYQACESAVASEILWAARIQTWEY
jgi:hypothetical protein